MGGKLTFKMKRFAECYATPGSPTFGNGTRSALAVYNTQDRKTATAIGTENLAKPVVRSYVQAVLQAHNLGVDKGTPWSWAPKHSLRSLLPTLVFQR